MPATGAVHVLSRHTVEVARGLAGTDLLDRHQVMLAAVRAILQDASPERPRRSADSATVNERTHPAPRPG